MSDYTTLTDRINALGLDETAGLNAVLDIVANAVPVEIDMDMYSEVVGSEELTDEQRETLAVVSTVYNLLADTAAKFAARDVRTRAEDLGYELLADEELFEKNKKTGEGVTSYHDLAHHSEEIVVKLGDIFDTLIDRSVRDAMMGLILSTATEATGTALLDFDALHDGEEL